MQPTTEMPSEIEYDSCGRYSKADDMMFRTPSSAPCKVRGMSVKKDAYAFLRAACWFGSFSSFTFFSVLISSGC
jgi:hypothetical protein